jgi:hypothetical protein
MGVALFCERGGEMKKMVALLLCLGLVGCSTYSTLSDLKRAGKWCAKVDITGNISDAKEIVREVAQNWDLMERKEAEKDDYMTFSTNFAKTMAKALFLGSTTRRLGFFFEYDKGSNITTITIVENQMNAASPIREYFVDKIKLKQMEKNK